MTLRDNVIAYAVKIRNLSKEEYEFLLKKIPKEKQMRAEKFKLKDDAVRTVLGYNLLYYILKKHFGIKKADISFGEYGKPFLKNENVFFSIAHSGEFVLCAAATVPVGIDIQKIYYDKKFFEVAESVFTKKEYDKFCGLDEKEKYEYFFDCWCAKEAAIKCASKGIFMIKNIETGKKICTADKKSLYYQNLKCFEGYGAGVCGAVEFCEVIPKNIEIEALL